MGLHRRAAVGAACAALVIGGIVGTAPAASALPKQCNRLYRIADTHWGYAEALYSVGDYAGYDHWMNVYDHDVANIIASGC